MREKEYEEMRAKLDRLTEYSLYILVFSLPISKSMVEICASVAIVSWLVKKVLGWKSSGIGALKVAATPINLPIWLFISISFLSIFWSTHPGISISAFVRKWLEYMAIFFIAAEVMNEKKKIRNVVVIIGLSAVLLSVDGLVQWLTGRDFLRGYEMVVPGRMQASFKYPGGFSSWLSIVIFPFISLFLYYKCARSTKLVSGIVSVLLFSCLILSFSKAALLAVFAAVFVLFFFRKRAKKMILAAGILFVALLARSAVYLVRIALSVPPETKLDFTELLYVFAIHSLKDRMYMWKTAWNMILDKPILGHGLNTFMANYVKFSPEEGQICGSGISYAHNSFLQITAEIGVFGLAAFLGMIIFMIKDSIKAQRLIEDDFLSSAHLGFFCGIIAFLVYSAFETNLYSFRLAVLFWYFLGVLMAIPRIGVKNAAQI